MASATKKKVEASPPPPTPFCENCHWANIERFDFHVECRVPLPPFVQKSHDWKHSLSNRHYVCALHKPKE